MRLISVALTSVTETVQCTTHSSRVKRSSQEKSFQTNKIQESEKKRRKSSDNGLRNLFAYLASQELRNKAVKDQRIEVVCFFGYFCSERFVLVIAPNLRLFTL
jgi:hypothetical protein